MSDRLYLSCRLQNFTAASLLRHFETCLSVFPFSKLAQRGPVLRVYAVEHAEPPAFEREFPLAAQASELITVAREFFEDDCAIELDAFWDLWQFDTEWRLKPVPVTFTAFGPDFEGAELNHIRADLGLDATFLPDLSIEGSLRMGESNLRSLLHFVGELERAIPLESRRLWSESGSSFAGTLVESLGRFEVN